MRVLTFGWDFPPLKNGGLGVACYGLTQELIRSGVEVVFVLPRQQEVMGDLRFVFADITPAKVLAVDSRIQPYQSSRSFFELIDSEGNRVRYSKDMLEEVYAYAHKAAAIALCEDFDVIHAHDWTAYLAGISAKIASGKPLIIHVHATSFDQAGSEYVDPEIYKIEKRAFQEADKVVTVSNYTRNMIIEKHGANPEKVEVVHNGVLESKHREFPPALGELKRQGKKIVLYHGRITIQKGVDYFVRAARKVVDYDSNVVFVISGWGDMERQVMHLVGALGLSRNVIFAGPLWDEDRDRMYECADLLVMPSVSEPFGLVPLEALQHGTPAIISKQSGVSEVLTHVLKVDFWDVDEMANKIIAALKYKAMNKQLVDEGRKEVQRLSWKTAAQKIIELYHKLVNWFFKK